MKEISGYELILSQQKRQQILFFSLLQEEEPVIAKKLEISTGVSRSTLFSDLDMAAEWLENHSLNLVRKPGYGIQLNGSEKKISVRL